MVSIQAKQPTPRMVIALNLVTMIDYKHMYAFVMQQLQVLFTSVHVSLTLALLFD